MKEPLVSILIPVYNVEKYIEKCLDSVVNQSIKNIEIICVNDGSTDNSLEILKKYQKYDDRIIVIDKKNGGLPSARNAGLDRARGKYIGFVDSDDFIEYNMYQKMVDVALENDSEVVICGAHIFPQEPKAPAWLEKCLSPEYAYYDSFQPEILFENPSTTPFLWRVLVKRSLISNNHLRLEESILLGEDKAFQTKIYIKANSITVIPDKLYHYCWYRSESMMQKDVYEVSDYKAKAHSRLVIHMSGILKNENQNTREKFLLWSIPFVYSDYIYMGLNDKIEYAEQLLEAWENCGYYNMEIKFPEWIKEQFIYFRSLVKEKKENIVLSYIVSVDEKAEYIQDLLNSICNQSFKEYEILIINNGASDKTYIKLHHALFNDKHIRLYNMEKKSYAETLNIGIKLALGKYIIFCGSNGWVEKEKLIHKWIQFCNVNNSDMCFSSNTIVDGKEFGVIQNKAEADQEAIKYLEEDFHNVLYRNSFLKKNGIKFREASFLTGLIFMAECIMYAKHKSYYSEHIYIQRKMFAPDWISTKKVEKILESLEILMMISCEKKNADVQAKILNIINGDYYKSIIINNTRAYVMPEAQCPNGENSQIKTIRSLYNIMQLVDTKLLAEGGYNMETPYTAVLCELMQERHRFLSNLSNGYVYS